VNFRFTIDARSELMSAAAFYDAQRAALGSEFAVEVGFSIAQVLDAPQRWSEIDPGFRKYRMNRFPFALIYRIPQAQLVEIVSVFDQRREPGSWRKNMRS
jgi:hypothetical protein